MGLIYASYGRYPPLYIFCGEHLLCARLHEASDGYGAADEGAAHMTEAPAIGVVDPDRCACTFVFRAGDGNDTITNFGYGSGGLRYEFGGGDKIQINGVVGGFGGLDIRQDGDDAIIGYGDAGDTITLLNVLASSLASDDFTM